MVTTTSFNAVFVLGSLPKGDLDTAEPVLGNAISPFGRKMFIRPSVARVTDRESLELELCKVLADVREHQLKPVVHLDCHGNKQKGLQLASGSEVPWTDFAALLQPINQASRNNLLVCSSMCFGGFLSDSLFDPGMIVERAPFWANVGPSKSVLPMQLLDGWTEFYRLFLAKHSAGDALRAAFAKWGSGSCAFAEDTVARVFAEYARESSDPSVFEARVERLLAGLPERNGAESFIRGSLLDYESQWQAVRRRFLHIDLFPDQDSRFKAHFDARGSTCSS